MYLFLEIQESLYSLSFHRQFFLALVELVFLLTYRPCPILKSFAAQHNIEKRT